MLRIVLDANVFLRALINPHSRCGRLLDEFADDYELVISPAIAREILEVLHRPHLRARFSRITELDVVYILALFEQATVVDPPDVPSVSRDPGDDKFLACARAAGAAYLVTEDEDLLVLGDYVDTRICEPAEFIMLLESRRAEG